MKSINILDKRDFTFEWKELIVFILDSIENRVYFFLCFIFFKCCEMADFMKTDPRFREGNDFNLPIGRQLKARQKCSFLNPLAF